MTNTDKFPNLDKSHWVTDDPNWVEKRKALWQEIKKPFEVFTHKNKRALGILEKYFMSGSIPDFEKLAPKYGEDSDGHLDLYCYLCFHPSWDEALLSQLRNDYINSNLVREIDVSSGFEFLFRSILDSSAYLVDLGREHPIFHSWGHNELLFRVMKGDLQTTRVNGFDWERDVLDYAFEDFIVTMTKWLSNPGLEPFNDDCLYNTDVFLDYLYALRYKDEGVFKSKKVARSIPYVKKSLYKIHHFDIEKEGGTCRTQFVLKMRKILDGREFIEEFKTMWNDVKSGKTVVKNAWKR